MLCFWEPGKTLEQIEVEAIYQALEYHGGNKTYAARDLGISLRTLRNWVRDHEELSGFSIEPQGPDVFRKRMAEMEIEAITEALRDAGQCHAEAARILGMNRTTLVEKMRRYGLLGGDKQALTGPAEVTYESLQDALTDPPLAPAAAPQAS